MKKLLLGALLVMGSISYGTPTNTVTVNITANVVATGSIEVKQGGTQITDLVYDGNEEVLDVVFTGSNNVTLQEITVGNIKMTNENNETFEILVDANKDTKKITLQSLDITKVDDGSYSGELIVNAKYS